ncbi:MAG: carboxypeptidase regulatory-like domain-containing protein [Acidobacteria bacterium]|nr:carboxypeptidase regulatory-like domain-containing protein [Acidobacteriota bacterium]MBI3655142.1 carboxypeptidase regulatory-like domain-containing protein [Acidobacteriota bacterium]
MMFTKSLRTLFSCGLITVGLIMTFFAAPVLSQNRAIRGKVLDDKGQPLPDVKIDINGMDMKRNYSTKTDKKGEYYHGGLQSGVYHIIAQKEGFVPDEMKGIRPPAGGDSEVNFKLNPGSGKLASQYTKEELEKMQKEVEEAKLQAKSVGEAKLLFDEGIKLSSAKQYPEAIAQFKQALAKGLDPKNTAVVWANLADAQSKQADLLTLKGQRSEAQQNLTEAITAFNQAIILDSANAGYYQNLAVALGKMGKIDEAKQAIEKANALDPTKAGLNYFNLGANMVNSGRPLEAIAAFQLATKTNPPHEEAFYQLGVSMLSDPALLANPTKSKDIIDVLQEYLKIGKNDGNKQAAKDIISMLEKSIKDAEAATKKSAPTGKAGKSKKGS